MGRQSTNAPARLRLCCICVLLAAFVTGDYTDTAGGQPELRDVTRRPHNASQDTTYNVHVRDNVTLPCQIPGKGKPLIVWRRQWVLFVGHRKVVDDARLHLVEGTQLLIESVRAHDAGQYACKVGSNPEVVQVHTLEVKGAPTSCPDGDAEDNCGNDVVCITFQWKRGGVSDGGNQSDYDSNMCNSGWTAHGDILMLETGDTLRLGCKSGRSDKSSKLRWKTKGGSDKFPLDRRQNPLEIKGVSSRDARTYVCKDDLWYQDQVRVEVLGYPPGISVSGHWLPCTRDSLFMPLRVWVCTVEDMPAFVPGTKVMWKKIGHQEALNETVVWGGGLAERSISLYLDPLQRADYGTYRCFAKNIYGKSKKLIRMSAYSRGSVISGRIIVAQGRNFTLTCQLPHNDGVKVTWKKQGMRLHPDVHNRYVTTQMVSSQNGKRVIRARLQVSNAQPLHSGMYTCHGSEVHYLVINRVSAALPKVSISFASSVSSDDIKLGDEINMKCLIQTSSPVEKVIWRRHGVFLYVSINGSAEDVFTVHVTSRRNGGLFTCTACTPEGEVESTPLTVTVKYAPGNPVLLYDPNPLHVSKNSSITLTCTAAFRNQGHPSPWFSWWKDSQHVTGVTSAAWNISAEDVGRGAKFSCAAVNELGQSETSFQFLQIQMCPTGWDYFSGHCYRVYQTGNTWKSKRAVCRRAHVMADMVSIHSETEEKFIRYQYAFFMPVWIGYSDASVLQDVYGWYSAEPVNSSWVWSDNTPTDYENWQRGEPDNLREERCAQMSIVGFTSGWKSDICAWDYSVVCKMPSVSDLDLTKVTLEANTTDTREGEEVVFECQIETDFMVEGIAWSYRDHLTHYEKYLTMNASEGVTIANETLVLHSVSMDNWGYYQCVVYTPYMDIYSNVEHLIVHSAPGQGEVTFWPEPLKVGRRLVLDCKLDWKQRGWPQADTFRWLKNGRLLPVTSRSWAIHSAVRGTGGEYTCVPVNALGEGEPASANITVLDDLVAS